MKILHLIDEPYDSGIVCYALTAARGLARRGHAVCVGGRPGAYPVEEARRLGLDTFPVRRFPAGLLDLRRLILRKGVELVNAHTGASHVLALAASGTLKLPPPVVRTRCESRPVRRSRAGRLLWRRTAGFIAPTERIVGQFRLAYPDCGLPARAVAQGIEGPLPAAGPEEPPGPPWRVGILGRLDPVKGHACFLQAAARVLRDVPETRFLVAGREENILIRELEGLASELGIAGQVEFLGHAPDAWAFLRSCHAGVVASLGSEAVSRAALEWMALARPIVATEVGGLPEIVEDGKTGFLTPPAAPEAMARRIAELLQNQPLRRRMGAAALERFKSGFSIPRFIEDTEKAFETAIRRIPSR